MKPRVMSCLVGALLLCTPAAAKRKEPNQCVVFFSVVENDATTVGLSITALNEPQSNWYKKHGNRGKLTGICYSKTADSPGGAPLYLIAWGEHLVSEPYTYTYKTTETETSNTNGTVYDSDGDSSQVQGTTTTDVPVYHTQSGVKRYYVADGRLSIWDDTTDDGKGSFVPFAPLHNHNRSVFTSASTSLLKNAIQIIREREKERLPQ